MRVKANIASWCSYGKANIASWYSFIKANIASWYSYGKANIASSNLQSRDHGERVARGGRG